MAVRISPIIGEDVDKSLDRRMLIGAGLLATLLTISGYVSYTNTRKLRDAAGRVTHTLEVLDLSGNLLRDLVDAQMAMRGFVITGDESFLEPYSAAEASLEGLHAQLREKTKDNLEQQQRLRQLATMTADNMAMIKMGIDLRRQDPAAAQQFVASKKPKYQLDAVRDVVAEFDQIERDLLQSRQRETDRAFRIAATFAVLKVAFGLAGIGVFVWVIRQGMIHRSHTQAALEKTAGELRESQGRLMGIVHSAMDSVISMDIDQRVILFNPAAERMFGYAAREMIGRSIEVLIPERFRSNHGEHVVRFGTAGATSRQMGHLGAVCGVRATGEEFPIEASISQMEAQGEKLFTVILRDITDRKRAEDNLRSAVEHLARSNAELEQFAYVASHDLQEPLRAIAGCVQILQKRYQGKLDPTADEYIGHTVEGAHRMQTLINDLLAYSRVSTRGKDLAPVNAETALSLALKNLETSVRERGAVVTNDPLPAVHADPTQLAQLFQNLVGNAIKFCRDRTPEIHIGVERGQGGWVFSVNDNGIGIAPEYFERIFGVFQRLHTRQEFPGTGIGLSICRKIVERHGGKIWIESALDHGSTFFFFLPDQGAKL